MLSQTRRPVCTLSHFTESFAGVLEHGGQVQSGPNGVKADFERMADIYRKVYNGKRINAEILEIERQRRELGFSLP